MTPIDTDHAHTPCVPQIEMQLDEVRQMFVFSCLSILGKSALIVALAAGLLTQFFPCCGFAIRSFSKVSATPGHICYPVSVVDMCYCYSVKILWAYLLLLYSYNVMGTF